MICFEFSGIASLFSHASNGLPVVFAGTTMFCVFLRVAHACSHSHVPYVSAPMLSSLCILRVFPLFHVSAPMGAPDSIPLATTIHLLVQVLVPCDDFAPMACNGP
eukprot:Gb_00614 [translate_table: standard]